MPNNVKLIKLLTCAGLTGLAVEQTCHTSKQMVVVPVEVAIEQTGDTDDDKRARQAHTLLGTHFRPTFVDVDVTTHTQFVLARKIISDIVTLIYLVLQSVWNCDKTPSYLFAPHR